ncbi:rhodanese-like domain [Desulfoluna spongiiphila]|nr:rhodanese-like domain [Desulfoluna spongiiphila]
MHKKDTEKRLACFVMVLALVLFGKPVSTFAFIDNGFYISVHKCRKLLKESKQAILVDVREKKQFESYRIPGSIHVPLHFIKARSFLKGKPVVLVNEGYRSDELEALAGELNAEGFQLQILSGGLNAWNRSGGKLAGNLYEAKQLNLISPQECFLKQTATNHLVVDASPDPMPESLPLIPGMVQVAFSDAKGGASELVKAILTRNSVAPFAVLITTKDGHGYEKLEKTLLSEGITNMFFLDGGLDRYRQFTDEVAVMKNPSVKTVAGGGCRTCPGFAHDDSIATDQ